MFKRRFILFILIGLVSTMLLPAVAETARCAVCGGVLGARYSTYGDKKLCSQQCVDQLKPGCCVCGKRVQGRYRTTADGKVFCGSVCFESTLPKCDTCGKPFQKGYNINQHHFCEACVEKYPRCFSCNLPAKYSKELKDGRHICSQCARWGVTTQAQAERHYDRARRELEAWTSIPIISLPKLQLVDITEMKTYSAKLRKTDDNVTVRGLYSRQVTTRKYTGLAKYFKPDETEEREIIYIVDYLHDEVFRVAAVHELMHDLIHEKFPHIEKGPLWLQEGICQYAAADFCRRKVYYEYLHAIENSPDPDYGDGYRYVNNIVGYQGWHGLSRWMQTLDVGSLPKQAPRNE